LPDKAKTGQPSEKNAQVWLGSLMDAMIEAIIVIDEQGTIERVNKAVESMFGYSTDEVVGQNVSVLMPQPDKGSHDNYMNQYMKTGERKIIGIGREVVAMRKDGSLFVADLAVGEVSWQSEHKFVGLMRDLTEKKQAEEQAIKRREEMIQASRVTTMGEMAASMAHELNQPLTAIANYASACTRLMHNPDPQVDAVRSALQNINTQAHRASEVIRRLRDFVRYDATTRETTSCADLIKEIMPLAAVDAKAHSIVFEIDVPDSLPQICVDSLQIQQVVINLLRNAIDAMATAEAEDRRLYLVGSSEGGDQVKIDVIDCGTGVPEEKKHQLFDAFFTTKPEGMGMGLAICRTIIQSHGGTLTCANNEERGATFTIRLPTRLE